MDYTEKLFLVPRNQVERLKESKVSVPIRQEVVHDLDTSIKNVLNRTDLLAHEKASQYSALLQRYLSLVKQSEQDTSTLKLMMPKDILYPKDIGFDQQPGVLSQTEAVVSEVLLNMPPRSRSNARYILDKLATSGEAATWNAQGEFISHGNIIRGSHIFDLVKRATSFQVGRKNVVPEGWGDFIKVIADLNIPLATMPSARVRSDVMALKQPFNPPVSRHDDFSTPVRPTRRSKKRLDWYTW